MPFALVGDEWWSHPKVLGASNAACGLWIRALSWSCHQRRDIVPPSFVDMVGGTEAEVGELVARGLWDPVEVGWCIHDWAEYQAKSLSEKRAEAGRKGGKASGEARAKQTDLASEANGEAGPVPSPSPPFPSVVVSPSGREGSPQDDDSDVKREAWSQIAAWKADEKGKTGNARWLASVRRNQPTDEHPDGGTFDTQADRLLEQYPNLTSYELAQALTGRLSKRSLALRAS